MSDGAATTLAWMIFIGLLFNGCMSDMGGSHEIARSLDSVASAIDRLNLKR